MVTFLSTRILQTDDTGGMGGSVIVHLRSFKWQVLGSNLALQGIILLGY